MIQRLLNVILDHGREWLELDPSSNGLLVEALRDHNWNAATICSLVSRNFYSPTVDQADGGFNCLHQILRGSKGTTLAGIEEALCLLIRANADIHAVNAEGLTVSAAASQRNRSYRTEGGDNVWPATTRKLSSLRMRTKKRSTRTGVPGRTGRQRWCV
jgi:hypothetical protein